MKRIAIIIGEHDPWGSRPYLLKQFLGAWRDHGIEVAINRGPRRQVDADVAFVHVDRTRVPEAYLELARTYPKRINAACPSISKRLIDSGRVRHGDGTDGPVIVKTARNAEGVPDRENARTAGWFARWRLRQADSIAKRAPWWVSGRTGRMYPVFEHPRAVPATVWLDPRFVVQRFVTQRWRDRFAMRRWYALGSASALGLCIGTAPYITAANTIGREWIDEPPPPEVLAARAAFGLDYCKIDYAVDEAGVVILDVNKTMGLGNAFPAFLAEAPRHLAAGILSLA